MTYSYDEIYLGGAMKNLGEALDYAVKGCGMTMASFMAMFEACGLSEKFGRGVPSVIAGLSGTELVMKVFSDSGLKRKLPPPMDQNEVGLEYWCGKTLAYYQWRRRVSFKDITKLISMEYFAELYPELVDISDEEVTAKLDSIIKEESSVSRVQKQRKTAGHTQKSLSEAADVNIRTLQQYELKAKDINRASSGVLARMARVLGCQEEDLLEFEFDDNN